MRRCIPTAQQSDAEAHVTPFSWLCDVPLLGEVTIDHDMPVPMLD